MGAVWFPYKSLDQNGAVISGAQANFYLAGTTTRQNAFTDVGLTTPTANPAIADANGLTGVYLNDTLDYDVDIRDAAGAAIVLQGTFSASTGVLTITNATTQAVNGFEQAINDMAADIAAVVDNELDISTVALNIANVNLVGDAITDGTLQDVVDAIDGAVTTADLPGLDTSRTGGANVASFRNFAGFLEICRGFDGSTFSPLDFDGTFTKNSFVSQYLREDAPGSTPESAQLFVNRFHGDGAVSAGAQFSSSIATGTAAFCEKHGDGSAHCFTGTGEIHANGSGGWNEIGLFQGQITNVGSQAGLCSLFEGIASDSPDNGVTDFPTRLAGSSIRLQKFNPSTFSSIMFLASGEGTEPIDTILGTNDQGLDQFRTGIDFSTAAFTTGRWAVVPNNTFLNQLDAGGVAVPVLGISAANSTIVAAPSGAGNVAITNSSLATRLQVDNNASDACLLWVGGQLRRVGMGAADSAGTGFRALITEN